MWVYTGSRVVVTLADGSAVRGKLGWCWAWGMARLCAAESIDGDEPVAIPGALLIPRGQILIAQVL